ncbi:MAG: DUF2330 domain-containing protein [Sedimentisphaerales bacterium]|nr:DUF2330 domain-containing protein [Sedimentisphaerales bacterium]
MNTAARTAFLTLCIASLFSNAYADGKFYYHEEVPPDIPYQRAFLIFHENTETLILQSKYEISKPQSIDSLGWVVPVPSVPEITSFDADIARRYFNMASMCTQPRTIVIWHILIIILYILLVCSLLSSLILQVFIIPALNTIATVPSKLDKIAKISFYTFIISFFVVLFMPALQSAGKDVEIIKAEHVGIYDVKVIKSENTDAILEWLKKNNFDFNEKDSAIFADYIRRNWCFVVAKVQPEPGTKKEKISSDRMVAPLVLQFDTEKAMYPVALTATIGTETQILLYTLSDNKLDCKDRLKLRTAREVYSDRFNPVFWIKQNQEPDELLMNTFKTIPPKMLICKFKDILTAEQMKKDIVFENAPDNKPYHETKVIW